MRPHQGPGVWNGGRQRPRNADRHGGASAGCPVMRSLSSTRAVCGLLNALLALACWFNGKRASRTRSTTLDNRLQGRSGKKLCITGNSSPRKIGQRNPFRFSWSHNSRTSVEALIALIRVKGNPPRFGNGRCPYQSNAHLGLGY